jgi:hypothetical protein
MPSCTVRLLSAHALFHAARVARAAMRMPHMRSGDASAPEISRRGRCISRHRSYIGYTPHLTIDGPPRSTRHAGGREKIQRHGTADTGRRGPPCLTARLPSRRNLITNVTFSFQRHPETLRRWSSGRPLQELRLCPRVCLDVRLRTLRRVHPGQEPRSITAKFAKRPHLTLSGHINMLK